MEVRHDIDLYPYTLRRYSNADLAERVAFLQGLSAYQHAVYEAERDDGAHADGHRNPARVASALSAGYALEARTLLAVLIDRRSRA
jgi:hypothetical protein